MGGMNSSNISAPENSEVALIGRLAAQALTERLQVMLVNPAVVLDLGCGLGSDLSELQKLFPQAMVYGIDISLESLREIPVLVSSTNVIAADAAVLPCAARSVDIIYSNLLIPWSVAPRNLLQEWRRVLKPGGLVIFSCFGSDSFQEWRELASLEVMPSIVDMHTVGDVLLDVGFSMPVVETDILSFEYSTQHKIKQEMYACHVLPRQVLTDLPLELTVEIVYAHAWCPEQVTFSANHQGDIVIPINRL